jgi:sucrose synthase
VLRSDDTRKNEIVKLYRIIEEYNLQARCAGLACAEQNHSGEIYRVIADHKGVFFQPALCEAFGLTILESMISGVPTIGTQFGGPLEIIQDKVNGFLINPTNHESMAQKILDFVSKCDQDPNYWEKIAHQGVERVYSTYTWKSTRHACCR